MAEKGSSSACDALQEELNKTTSELYDAKSDLERAEEDRKKLSAQVSSVLSEVEDMKTRMHEFGARHKTVLDELEDQRVEAFNFKRELIMCRKDLQAAGTVLEGAQRVTAQERNARVEAEASLKAKELELMAVQKELAELRGSLPAVKVQAVEDFCNTEGPLLKVSDSFVAGFYTCKETALQHPDELADLEVPTEIDVTPELEAKIAERRGDALAVLQLIRAEEPDILAKWETGVPSPQKDGEEADEENDQQQ